MMYAATGRLLFRGTAKGTAAPAVNGERIARNKSATCVPAAQPGLVPANPVRDEVLASLLTLDAHRAEEERSGAQQDAP